jgi:hypothetical protein
MESWGDAVSKQFSGAGKPEPTDAPEVYVNLQPDQTVDAKAIEDSLMSGLRKLKSLTKRLSIKERLEFAGHEARLVNLLQDKSLHGTNETVRSEISKVVYELNRLVLAHFDTTFTDLCIS